MTPEELTKKAWGMVIQKIRELRSTGETYESVGKRCGVSKATVQRWDKSGEGGEDTSFANMIRYFTGLSIDMSVLVPVQQTVQSVQGTIINDNDLSSSLAAKGMHILGVYDVAGAGPAWEISEGEPMLNIAIPSKFIRQNTTALIVSGNSMEPTILNGAIVGVDVSPQDIIQGQIYAVRLPYEGIVIKRLFLNHEKECFVLRSDNKNGEYPDIHKSYVDGDHFVYGKVTWVMQAF